MFLRALVPLLCCLLLMPSQTLADADAAPDRPRIGLVLSGGGARGAAHIGVIRALERLRIPVDYVAGTSMGAIVGGLYASGMTVDELEEALLEVDWEDIFNDTPAREDLSRRRKFDNEIFQINKSLGLRDGTLAGPTGLIQGRKLDLLLERLTAPVAGIRDFDRLPIPFRAVASDIVTGRQVVLGDGGLAAAIRASMSIPGFIARVEIDGRLLVDGGIANNLPVDVVRDMGADVVIAVDISTPLLDRDELNSAVSIAYQLSGFLTRQNTEARIATLTDEDVLIVPQLGGIGTTSFKRAGEAVPLGEKAAKDGEAELARYALDDTAFRRHVAERLRPPAELPLVQFVRIENRSRMDDEVIRTRVHVKTGERLDIAGLEQDMAELYGLDIFDTVRYDVVEENGETGVVVTVREKPWGPRYLQFGFQLSSSSDAGNELGLVLGYTVTPSNRLGGEWRSLLRLGDEQGLLTEWYQPFAVDSPYFVLPQLYYRDRSFNVFEDDQIIAEDRVRTFGGRLTVGRELGTWGRLSAGLLRETGDVVTGIGPPTLEGDIDGGAWFAGFSVDTLDDIYFPRRGMEGSLAWESSTTGLGADSDFDQLQFDFLRAASWDVNTLLLGLRYFATVDGDAPLANNFRAGGQFLLPGYADNALTGDDLVVLRTGYQRRIRDLLNFPTYVAGTLQYGNVFQDEEEIDVDDGIFAAGLYLGVDTVLGPVYVGYGYADTNNNALYLSIGNRF